MDSSDKRFDEASLTPPRETPYADDKHERVVLEGLRPTTLGLSLLFAFCGVLEIVLPVSSVALALVAFVTALIFLALHIGLTRWRSIPVPANGLAALVATLVALNSLLHLAFSESPAQTANLMLVILGAGYFLTSTRWLAVVLIFVSVGWWVVHMGVALRDWQQFGLALALAVVFSVIIHTARGRSRQRLADLRAETEARAEILRRRARQLETLMSMSHSINSFLDLDTLLNHIVDHIQSSFDCDYVGVLLADGSGETLILHASATSADWTSDVSRRAVPVGAPGLIGWAAAHSQAVSVGDVSQDTRCADLAQVSDVRSQMVLPLIANGALLGELDMRDLRRDAFSDDDRRVCESLADQVATAVQNAARFELERSRRLLMETLHQVGYALSQTLDLTEVLDLIIADLGKLVPFDRGAILLADGDELEIVAAYGFPDLCAARQIRVSIKEDDVFDHIYKTKAPLAVPELENRKDWEYVEPLPRARSWVGLPLVNEADEVIGMLSLTREQVKPYSDDEIELGTAYAHQAAAALQNARLYQELSDAYARLADLDRAKSDFIALASHELRTPLTVAIGYSHLLAEEPTIRQDMMVMEMVEGLIEGVERLQEIVNCLMDVAEIESDALQLYPVPVNIGYVIEEEVLQFADALRMRQISLHVKPMDKKLPQIEADRAALHKVFHQLIMNAIKFTPDGGKITIQGSTVTRGYRGITVPALEITIADTGVGIDPKDHERIFETFFRIGKITFHSSSSVNFQGGGPGLGLAIVKGVVESHHGQVWVESEGFDPVKCPGSCFHVLLPLTSQIQPGNGAGSLWDAMGYHNGIDLGALDS